MNRSPRMQGLPPILPDSTVIRGLRLLMEIPAFLVRDHSRSTTGPLAIQPANVPGFTVIGTGSPIFDAADRARAKWLGSERRNLPNRKTARNMTRGDQITPNTFVQVQIAQCSAIL